MVPSKGVLATAAHDLRNPLSGILTAAEYLIEDASGLLESEHLAMLHSIESSSRQMLALIDDLAEISSIEPDGLDWGSAPRDLVRLVRGVVVRNRMLLDSRKIRIVLTFENDPPRAEVDSRRVQQAIQRLLGLAIRDLAEGSRIVIRVASVNKNAVISIPFRGAGVPAGDRLSVLLIERIARAHGGAFRSGDEPGIGPVLRLTLPLSGGPHAKRQRRLRPVRNFG